jgi:hypothetical protein
MSFRFLRVNSETGSIIISITKTIAMNLAPLDILGRGIALLGPFRLRKQEAQEQLF